ncbi:MAG: transaldolase [Anaerolineales bacterium]|jgi:transaldolase
MNKSQKVFNLSQSIWYDNIERSLLVDGGMADMIDKGLIYGVTSNPSIFNNAIAKTNHYDSDLVPLVKDGKNAEEIFEILAVEDIRCAADLFSDMYISTNGGDGYVSLEVNPDIANDTRATISEAKRLWDLVDRSNLMIKIPATKEGLPAITDAIVNGLNVNVTLIFSLERYEQVMDAYLKGLETRILDGEPVENIASVASFFVSRIDTKVDNYLDEIISLSDGREELAKNTQGKVAVASAKEAYQRFQKVFGSERFTPLQEKGARVQRPLWASTSTKNPNYSDVLYVDSLIGPDTVNTIPPSTLLAFNDHGVVKNALEDDLDEARKTLSDLDSLGISINQVTEELENEGVAAFSSAYHKLLDSVEARRFEIV